MNEYYIEGGQYSIYDPDRYSTANYVKDAAIIAAAGLVGCLYGVAAGAMLIASIAALSVLRAVELGVVVGVGVYVGIKHGSPVGVAGSVLGGAVVGAAGLAFVATAIAFTAANCLSNLQIMHFKRFNVVPESINIAAKPC